MKFKKDGCTFESMLQERDLFCGYKYSEFSSVCPSYYPEHCKLHQYFKEKGLDENNCSNFCKENPRKAAQLVGFEVIEEEGDKMELPIDIGSMTLAQAKEYCRNHAEENASCACACTEDCKLNHLNMCGYNPSAWNLDRLTPQELEICTILGAKWISCDNEISGVTLWVDKPTFNYMMNKFMSAIGSIAEISKEKFPSVKPHDCISVDDLL